MSLKSSLFNVLLGLDLGAGGLGGIPGITISAHAGMAALDGSRRGRLAATLIDSLTLKRGHCYGAVLGDLARAQVAADLCGRYADKARAALSP